MSATASAWSSRLAAAFRNACLGELEALKPGNVHVFADGHGMVVQDFVKSAEVVSEVIAQPGLGVGQRIAAGIEATWQAVGCNTNLGIVLLAAPMLQAVLRGDGMILRERLCKVLRGLTVEDAREAFRAIVRAAPAGLGEGGEHDVRTAPQVTLLEAMRSARERDRIALQYATDYADVFELGVKRYREALQRWGRPAWATTAVYLGFLAAFDDTHVFRKYGTDIARDLRHEAEAHEKAFLAQDNPKLYMRPLLDFDRELKARGLNPGTSADLTVATLLAVELENMMTEFNRS